MDFKLVSPYQPTGDQPQAIDALTKGLTEGLKHQVLLGVTGSGKTFTLANVIKNIQMPALVISHNKTLAAQLYQEFRDFFPHNAVSYFVSYYDYYQPEAYIPQTDTYIEKETEINEEIDKLRLSTTTNLLTRKDTIVVASVSCIYNIGSPVEYGKFVLELKKGVKVSRDSILKRLVDLQYTRSNFQFKRGTFRIRGENIDIYPAYQDSALRITLDDNFVENLVSLDSINGNVIDCLNSFILYPAKHFMTDPARNDEVFRSIRDDLDIRLNILKKENRLLEAERLKKRINFDLEMISEVGYVNGIENYSRYFDKRSPGEAPYTLLDYYRKPYGDDWLLIIDESHMTIPQIRGMYNGDRARKQTLIDFGFRLPSALDNRPLKYHEFLERTTQIIYVSATPDEYELSLARDNSKKLKKVRSGVVEQLIRPTGIMDPEVIVRSTEGQIKDLIKEIIERKKKHERVLVTTLTKRMAEDLAAFLNDKSYILKNITQNLKEENLPVVEYLHSDIVTLERSDILDNLRRGVYDVLIGINLLREGLDLPEVTLVAILDADKEGFLRSSTSLIQTMGRAARHVHGSVIMYADHKTRSMINAIAEVDRRRKIQLDYNKKNKIEPKNIEKPFRGRLVEKEAEDKNFDRYLDTKKRIKYRELLSISPGDLTPKDRKILIIRMEREMKDAAQDLNFELAAEIRDKIRELKQEDIQI